MKSDREVLHHAHEVPVWVTLAPLVFALSGIALSYVYYIVQSELPALTARRFPAIYALFYNKWYFDEIYDAVLRAAGARDRPPVLEEGRRGDDRRRSAPTTSPPAPRTWRAC